MVSTVDWRDAPPSLLSMDGPRVPLTRTNLPEVVELVGQGWTLAPEAPAFSFLPAVFPPSHRAWVHDRSTWYWREFVDDVELPPRPAPPEDIDDVRRLNATLAALCGYPDWDGSRIWLLRGGPPATVEQILERIGRRSVLEAGGIEAGPELARIAADEVALAIT